MDRDVIEPQGGEISRVRELRVRLGLSQEQLAQRLGVSFVTVNRWETGHSRLSATARRRLADLESSQHTLPATHTSFIGRQAEIAALTAATSGTRLLSLVGPGGAGKTRLALELARRTAAPGERVVFVALDALPDPALTEASVAAAFGLRDKAGSPAVEALVRTLGDAPVLLIFDGAERAVANVRTAGIAALAEHLIAGTTGTRILITSRKVTGTRGERVWPVPPMTADDAVRLFAARAQERLPSFQPSGAAVGAVDDLCERLDRLPLAIELAAGWVGTLSVDQILRRGPALAATLDDAGILHSVAESSFALLCPAEQALLCQISVFAGSFTLDDVQAVVDCDAGLIHLLRGLVESSWLIAADDRFRVLSTLREYAAARLECGQAERVRARHAAHFAALAEASADMLAGGDRAAWVHRLQESSADLDAALDWAARTADIGLGLAMSATLWRWWLTTGQLAAGRQRLNYFLAAADGADPFAIAQARRAEAVLAVENGDYADAIAQARAALAVFDAGTGTESVIAAARTATALGAAYRNLGDREAAARYFDIAARRWRATSDERGLAGALNNQALMMMDSGDTERARQLLEQVLTFKRRHGDPRSVALGLHNLGHVLRLGGHADESAAALTEAAEVAAYLGDRQLHGAIACTHGDLLRQQGDFAVAVEYYEEALEHYRTAGTIRDVVIALRGLGLCLHYLGRTAEGRRMLREGESLAVTAKDASRIEAIRAALAELASVPGQPQAREPLTARQAEVLSFVAAGLTNKAIAAKLHLSVGTVERHLATCYQKLGLRNRSDATRYAIRHGLSPTETDT